MRPETFESFRAHSVLKGPKECCGLIVRMSREEQYWPCRNLSETPDAFRIHPEDWARAEDTGTVSAVCHSHPGASRMPSPMDRISCDLSGLPWFILGADGLHRLDPADYALEGRPFVFGWADCWTLARDYFGASWPDFPRVWGQIEGLFEEHLHDFGFREVEQAEPGDVLFMQVRGHGINHMAIYLGNGMILHHGVGELSRKVPIGQLAECVRKIMRRPE